MILVLGASGTVGSEVVRQLAAKGVKFRAAYRDTSRAPRGVSAVKADFDDPASIDAALRGVDHLFLLSPSQAAQETSAVKAARAAGVQHVVKLSVWGAEGAGFSFARIHRPVEQAIEKSGIGWTFLRPNGFMQNMANYNGATIKSQGAFYGAVGDARISHIDVRDIAAAAVVALTAPGHMGKAYSLSGPEALTYAEIANKLSSVTGREIRYVDLPPEQLKAGMTGAGIPGEYADWLLDLNRYYREGHAARITGDVKQLIGRDPISYDWYVRDYASAFQA